MPNQPKSGSRQIALRLSQEQVERLIERQKAHNQALSEAKGLSLAAFARSLLMEKVVPPPSGDTTQVVPPPAAGTPVVPPKEKPLDAMNAQKQLEEQWGRGGQAVVRAIVRAHWPEFKAWLTEQRLIGG